MIQNTSPIGIAIHGGAGTILKKDMSDSLERQYRESLSDALKAGYDVLEKGGTSLDAVQAAILLMEDSPLFNAGKGAVLTNQGHAELDASIKDGNTGKAGAVGGVEWDGQKLNDRGFLLGWGRSAARYDFSTRFKDLGSRLRADLGFVPQVGYQQFDIETGHKMYPSGVLSFARVYASGEYVVDHEGEVISREATPLGVLVFGKNNLQAFAGFSVGSYRTGPELLTRKRVNYLVQVDPSRRFTSIALQGYLGEDIDLATTRVGNGGEVTAIATLRPEPHLTIEAIASTSSLDAKEGDGRLFSANIQRVKATYNASARAFLHLCDGE